MYLHREDRELLRDVIVTVSENSGIEENIVEKDYYVTLILKELANRNPEVIFKGGTSLSKAYHIIDRFSEDIDIAFEERLGEAKRKKLKYELLKPISDKLELPIENWNEIESDRDYNHYDFQYASVGAYEENILRPHVKLETALMSYSYPTEERDISSIIYDSLHDSEPELITKYGLEPFRMRTQSLVRTFIDKLFAVCDYYMLDKPARNSRHLYDIYKLYPNIVIDDQVRLLVDEVRQHRTLIGKRIAPAAESGVDILQKAEEIVRMDFYAKDYEDSTMKLIRDHVEYEDVLRDYLKIMNDLFARNN